jgi:dihydropyrimidinase
VAYDLVVAGGLVATATDAVVADLGIRGGRIATIDQGLPANEAEIDARGLIVMPGGVDVHTHLDLDLGGMRTGGRFRVGDGGGGVRRGDRRSVTTRGSRRA